MRTVRTTRPAIGNPSLRAEFLAEKTSQFGPVSTFPGWKGKWEGWSALGCNHVCPISPPHRHVVDGRHSIRRKQ
jgi:hypothetical protein